MLLFIIYKFIIYNMANNKIITTVNSVTSDYTFLPDRDNVIVIDTSNNRIGINTVDPEHAIHVSGGTIKTTNLDVSNVVSDLVPLTDLAYSLGSADKQWSDLYVGPGSIYMNGQKILSKTTDGKLKIEHSGIIEFDGSVSFNQVPLYPPGQAPTVATSANTGSGFIYGTSIGINQNGIPDQSGAYFTYINVSQDSSFNNSLYIDKNLTVNEDISLNHNLYVGQDVSLNSNLFLQKDASLNSNLYIGNDVSINRNLFLEGDASLNSNLYIGQDVSINRNLFLEGDASFINNVDISSLTVLNDASFNNNVDISSLTVLNDASFNNNVDISSLTVLNNISLNQNLYVGNDVSFNNNLFLFGDASFNNNVEISNNLIVLNDASFNNNVDISNNLIVNGNIIGNLSGGIYITSSVTDLSDVTSSGSGQIITNTERTKLAGIAEDANNFGGSTTWQGGWDLGQGSIDIVDHGVITLTSTREGDGWNSTIRGIINLDASYIINLDAGYQIRATGALLAASDDRLKHNEIDISNALSIIRQLKPQKYQKTKEMKDANYIGDLSNLDWRYEAGFIAQDILKINNLDYLVGGGDYIDDSGNEIIERYYLNYNDIFTYGIAATKELDAKNTVLETELATTKMELATIKTELATVKTMLNNVLLTQGLPTI